MKDETGLDEHYARYDIDLERPTNWIVVGGHRGYPDPECLEGALAELMFLKPDVDGEDRPENVVGTIRVFKDRVEFMDGCRGEIVRTIEI